MSRRNLFGALLLVTSLPAVDLLFEAEDVTTPESAWLTNRTSSNRWNLWSTDNDAARKWSGGRVLQSPVVSNDRDAGEEGAPVLHTRISGLSHGAYEVTIRQGRTLGVSLDGGATWRRISDGLLGEVNVTNGVFELWVDDRFVNQGNVGSAYYDSIRLVPLSPRVRKPPVRGFAKERVRERLDEGLVALRRSTNAVTLSWRLLEEAGTDPMFHVYRKEQGGEVTRLTKRPIGDRTFFRDEEAPKGRCFYAVGRADLDGGGIPGAFVETAAWGESRPYLSLPLEKGVTVQKVGLGDLDGDGRLDFVLKTPDENIDPYAMYWKKSPDTYRLEAYRSDGTPLWKHDLGWSIERGVWYSPFLVADLDGDGRAEVIAKTGEGDPREEDGRVRSGNEWATVFDGATGRELARWKWPARKVGDLELEYNYASRNQIGLAHLDGKTPCLILARGTYTLMQAEALQFHGGRIEKLWSWSGLEERPVKRWSGQGAHTLQAHDLDGDGRDEIVLGSAVLDPNGNGLWSTGFGHPDHCYVGKIDPKRPGLQIFYGMETAQKESNGMCLVDAATGKVLWGHEGPTRHVHGTGFCADVDPRFPGLEMYGCDTDMVKNFERGWLRSAAGDLIEASKDLVSYRPVFWTADETACLLRGTRISRYGNPEVLDRIEGKPVLIADVLGDWREEIFTTLPGELRIYTTGVAATNRRTCTLQDPVYRATVRAASQGYFYNAMRGR